MNPFNVAAFVDAVAIASRVHAVCTDPPVQRAARVAVTDVRRAVYSIGKFGVEVSASWSRPGEGPAFAGSRF